MIEVGLEPRFLLSGPVLFSLPCAILVPVFWALPAQQSLPTLSFKAASNTLSWSSMIHLFVNFHEFSQPPSRELVAELTQAPASPEPQTRDSAVEWKAFHRLWSRSDMGSKSGAATCPWPWATYLTLLTFHVLICRTGIINSKAYSWAENEKTHIRHQQEVLRTSCRLLPCAPSPSATHRGSLGVEGVSSYSHNSSERQRSVLVPLTRYRACGTVQDFIKMLILSQWAGGGSWDPVVLQNCRWQQCRLSARRTLWRRLYVILATSTTSSPMMLLNNREQVYECLCLNEQLGPTPWLSAPSPPL